MINKINEGNLGKTKETNRSGGKVFRLFFSLMMDPKNPPFQGSLLLSHVQLQYSKLIGWTLNENVNWLDPKNWARNVCRTVSNLNMVVS